MPFFLAAFAHAINTVAVLEIVPSGEQDLTVQEYRHLTDELRTRAMQALPKSSYAILTRDNIMSLMPPDSEEAQCLAESCAIDIGRAIGAEYVTQGFVGKFGGMFTLTVELYESVSGHLKGSFVTESENAMGLLATIREKAPGLFAEIKKEESLESTVDFILDNEGSKKEKIKINPQVGGVENKSNASFWVALAFDVLGAALLCNGYFMEREVVSRNDKYSSLGSTASQSDFNSAWSRIEDAKTARNFSYVAGGILLATGIGVYIWF